MQRKIYWAAPLHDLSDQERNIEKVKDLRAKGHLVYLPQEHGVWNDFEDPVEAGKMLYGTDMEAMQMSDCCIAYCGDREPSEGMLFEIGYMRGCNKPVYLLNDKNWPYGLMITYGVTKEFKEWEALLTHLSSEDFVGLDVSDDGR